MKNKTQNKAFVLLACLIGIFVLMVVCFGLIESQLGKTGDTASTSSDRQYRGQIIYDSLWYKPKDSLTSILILGVDKTTDTAENKAESEQVDFLALLLLDREAESFQILHLNRDTMTDIIQTDITGTEIGTFEGQLALAHAYGSDEKARCRNTLHVVENLLYGIEIDHYISLTMDAVSILNDSVGGVTLPLLDDFTYLDPTYTKGTTVTLTGKEALTYVRARSTQEDSSNLHRMERQRQYIDALFDTYVRKNTNNDGNTFEILLKVSEYIASDCTADQLTRLTEQLGEFFYSGIQYLEGEAMQGPEFMEYHIDETAAQKTVIDLFYEPIPTKESATE